MTPIIGISTNLHTVDKGKFLGMERIYVNKDYIDAVVKAGGIPLLLPPVADRASIVRYAEVCDGFILSGGGDINPILYGDFPHPCLEEFHTGLDRAQWALTEEILRQASISHLPGNTIIECRIGRYALAGYHSHRPSGYATQPIQPTGGYFPPGKY